MGKAEVGGKSGAVTVNWPPTVYGEYSFIHCVDIVCYNRYVVINIITSKTCV